MSKFKFIIIVILSFLVFNLNASALVLMCLYDDGNGGGHGADISIYTKDDLTNIYFYADLDVYDKTTGHFNFDTYKQMLADYFVCDPDCPSFFRFSESYKYIFSADDYGVSKTGDVTPTNEFVNRLVCPKQIIFGTWSSYDENGNIDSNARPKLVMFNEDSDLSDAFWNDYSTFSSDDARRYVLVEPYSFFDNHNAIYSYNYNECNASVDDLISLFNLDSQQGWFSQITENEKVYMASIYDGLGFDNVGNDILKRYSQGGVCYMENKDNSDKYNELVNAVNIYFGYSGKNSAGSDVTTCNAIIGDPDVEGSFAYYLRLIFKIMCYVATCLLVCLTIFDYSKYIFTSNGDDLSKYNKRTIIRIVLAIVIFMLPTLINSLMYLFGFYDTCFII